MTRLNRPGHLKKMKRLLAHIFCFAILLLAAFEQSNFAQCSLIDNSQGALFITYERTAQVKVEGKEKAQAGIILRLHNNSTCAVIITTGSADNFYKPLPVNPTVLQRVNREIDYDLPDEGLVPEVRYQYQSRGRSGMSGGGDMFFGFRLLGSRSMLFEVPFTHLAPRYASKIVLPFQYAWEQEGRGKVVYSRTENFVTFWSGSLPDDIKQKIRKY